MSNEKYIAGYMEVHRHMLQPLPSLEEIALGELRDKVVAETIPIYTMKRPNPKSGKADCPITTREKEHFRYLMKTKLQAAGTEEERQKVIDHYKEKWSE